MIRSTFVVDEQGAVEVAQYNVKATGHVAKLRRDLGLALLDSGLRARSPMAEAVGLGPAQCEFESHRAHVSAVQIVPFEDGHADGIARLSTTVRWPSLTAADTVRAVCTAPGSSATSRWSTARSSAGRRPWGTGSSSHTCRSWPCIPTTGAGASRGC